MTLSSSSSPFDNLTGIAYGKLVIEDGVLCLFDKRVDVYMPLITSERSVAECMANNIGERVRLRFELNDLSHAGYITPRQAERCPEEYAPPRMEGLIFTDQDECGLQYRGGDDEPCILGHLMSAVKNSEIMRPHSFILSPVDFMVLAGSLADSADAWMTDMVIHAQLELQWAKQGRCRFQICNLISTQDLLSWDHQQSLISKPFALPGAPDSGEPKSSADSQKPQRRAISSRLRYEILRRDGHRCVDCGASAQDDPLVRLEIDHRIPVSKGGTNDPDNLQTLCWACNNGKSDRVDHKLNLSDPWEIAC